MTSLKWSQVDMQRKCAWVHADEAKSNKSIGYPLNSDALEVIRSQISKNNEFIFTNQGLPVNRPNTAAWHKALERVGISDFRWHLQNGMPLHVLKELGGWANLKMVLRYAHLSSNH
nr:site-specific integrase [Methylobacter psychrophilus]